MAGELSVTIESVFTSQWRSVLSCYSSTQGVCMDALITGKYVTADGHTADIQYRLRELWYGYVCEFPAPGQRSVLQKWNRDGIHPEVPGWNLKLKD